MGVFGIEYNCVSPNMINQLKAEWSEIETIIKKNLNRCTDAWYKPELMIANLHNICPHKITKAASCDNNLH
jgi:hypothetical protein